MWSLGVILYMLLCGEPPWSSNAFSDLCEKVIAGAVQVWAARTVSLMGS